jgi:hypothetical protein
MHDTRDCEGEPELGIGRSVGAPTDAEKVHDGAGDFTE